MGLFKAFIQLLKTQWSLFTVMSLFRCETAQWLTKAAADQEVEIKRRREQIRFRSSRLLNISFQMFLFSSPMMLDCSCGDLWSFTHSTRTLVGSDADVQDVEETTIPDRPKGVQWVWVWVRALCFLSNLNLHIMSSWGLFCVQFAFL